MTAILHPRARAVELDHLMPVCTGISRAVAILSTPLTTSTASSEGRGDQMLLVIPPGSISPRVPPHPVRVLQLGPQSLAAPRDRYRFHSSKRHPSVASSHDHLTGKSLSHGGVQHAILRKGLPMQVVTNMQEPNTGLVTDRSVYCTSLRLPPS